MVTTWENRYSDEYLKTPEDIGFRVRYRMDDETGRALGRLHVVLQSAYTATGGQPIFVLNLTARGKPEPGDLAGAFQLFDHEHEWIVRGLLLYYDEAYAWTLEAKKWLASALGGVWQPTAL